MGIIWTLNLALGKLFNLLLAPFSSLNPLWGLAAVSLITGAVMVFIFKYVSNQDGIRRAKAKVRGHFLEVWLYKHDFKVVTGSIGRIFAANLRYMRYAVAPLIVLVIPVALIMAHLNLRYSSRPLDIGETSTLTVKFDSEEPLLGGGLTAEGTGGIEVETAPVRALSAREVSWRIRAVSPGKHIVKIIWGGGEIGKEVVVGAGRVTKTSAVKSSHKSLSDALFLPGEKPLPAGSEALKASVIYSERRLRALGIDVHWIVIFFVLSIAAGFALKGVIGVEI